MEHWDLRSLAVEPRRHFEHLRLPRRLDLFLECVDAAVDELFLVGGAFLARRDGGGKKHEAGQKQADAEA